MPSKIVRAKIKSILEVLTAGHSGGIDMPAASRGRERELFINMVLGNIISQPFRIGSGAIVDQYDSLSGQVDIVIEYANTLSFPSIYAHSERLYLAESICAVIEVKSNLSSQWVDVCAKADAVFRLRRNVGATGYVGGPPPKQIPLFAVGYKGWQSPEAAAKNLAAVNQKGVKISGILQIDPCFYVAANPPFNHSFEDERGLFGFLLSIEQLTSSMLGSKPPFMRYVK